MLRNISGDAYGRPDFQDQDTIRLIADLLGLSSMVTWERPTLGPARWCASCCRLRRGSRRAAVPMRDSLSAG